MRSAVETGTKEIVPEGKFILHGENRGEAKQGNEGEDSPYSKKSRHMPDAAKINGGVAPGDPGNPGLIPRIAMQIRKTARNAPYCITGFL